MDSQKYDALKIENQLCFPLYACSREVIKQYKPFLDKIDLDVEDAIALHRILYKILGKENESK